MLHRISFLFLLCFFGRLDACFSKTLINIKYHDRSIDISNNKLSRQSLKRSSFVKEMYYDKIAKYLIVKLSDTYYHYCKIPPSEINKWLKSRSLGSFYNRNIRGSYSCQGKFVGEYT